MLVSIVVLVKMAARSELLLKSMESVLSILISAFPVALVKRLALLAHLQKNNYYL
jgi:hypothetical protein